MRILGLLLAATLLTGCTDKHLPATMHTPHLYSNGAAGSLAFSPPIAQNEPTIILPRDLRQPGAFVGFDEITTSYFYIRTDDRMTNDGSDHYVRRSIIEKVGVSYR